MISQKLNNKCVQQTLSIINKVDFSRNESETRRESFIALTVVGESLYGCNVLENETLLLKQVPTLTKLINNVNF